jgi:phosphate transport system permease protein
MNTRKLRDLLGTNLMLVVTAAVSLLFFTIFFFLIFKSLFILESHSLTEILFSSSWNPGFNQFGLYPIIVGTILVTGIALLIAVPISILSAIYIAEYAPKKIRRLVRPFIDVLAGVPSVVYGL